MIERELRDEGDARARGHERGEDVDAADEATAPPRRGPWRALSPVELDRIAQGGAAAGGSAAASSASPAAATAGPAAASAGPTTKPPTAVPPPETLYHTPQPASTYAAVHHARLLDAMAARMAGIAPGDPHLSWRGDPVAAFTTAARDVLGTRDQGAQLAELVRPGNLAYAIDLHRALSHGVAGVEVDGKPALGPMTWSPVIGLEVALLAEAQVRASLMRMAPRYVAQAEEKRGQPVEVPDLVTSHPMDRVIARLLCDREATVYRPGARHRRGPTAADPPGLFRHGLRAIEDFVPAGQRDPQLWNWIEVRAPRDATVEEVAAALFLDLDRTDRAEAITGAAPFFRLPPSWARSRADLAGYEPRGQHGRETDEERAARDHEPASSLALADSALATDAAIAQAADERRHDRRGVPLPADRAALAETLDRSARQLGRAGQVLGRWQLAYTSGPAHRWVERLRDDLAAVSDGQLIRLAPAIEGQQGLLFEAIGALDELDGLARQHGVVPGSDEAARFTPLIQLYGTAMGESHLVDSARATLDRARALRARLPLDLVAEGLRRSRTAVDPAGDAAARATQDTLERGLGELRGQQLAGGAIDVAQLEGIAVSGREQMFSARLRALRGSIEPVKAALVAAGRRRSNQALSLVWSELYELPATLDHLVAELDHVEDDRATAMIRAMEDFARSPEAHGSSSEVNAAVQRRRARVIADAERALEATLAELDLERKLYAAYDELEEAQWRALVAELLALTAVSAGAGMGGAAMRGVVSGSRLLRAGGAAGDLLSATRSAEAWGTVAGLTTDAVLTTGGQRVVLGDGADSTAFNLLSNVAALAALRPLQDVARSWKAGAGAAEAANLTLWQRVGATGELVLLRGTEITGELITSAAIGYAAERVRGRLAGEPAPDPATVESWAIQGASIALGRFVSGRLSHLEERLALAGAAGADLRARARRQAELADAIDARSGADEAMAVAIGAHKLIEDERAVLDLLAERGALRPETLAALRAGHERERGLPHELTGVALRLAGLTPDDPSGARWAGSQEDITIALDQVRAAGTSVDIVKRGATGEDWQAIVGGRPLILHVTAPRGRPAEAAGPPSPERAARARRYAEAATRIQATREAAFARELEARPVIEVEHLQVGYGPAGLMNQASLPESGVGLGDRLVIYEHGGPLTSRGDLELGQEPAALDGPGLRTSEQDDGDYVTSAAYGRAVAVGRVEQSAPAYHATVVGRESRPVAPGPDWAAPGRAQRVRVRAPDGAERWIYADRIDGAIGAGPPSQVALAAVAPDAGALIQAGLVIAGDDPAFAAKLRGGGRVLVWGGSATGDWAAEDAVRLGRGEADLVGDVPVRDARDRLRAALQAAQDSGDPAAIEAAHREYFAAAHSGAALERNVKPGSAHDHPRVHVDIATPTRIERTSDGRLQVTFDRPGGAVEVKTYDQVITAHGQDHRASGGAAALLGAHDAADRVLLRPVLDERGRLVAVESIAPPAIRLVGAVAASRSLTDWIAPDQRALFKQKVAEIATEADGHHLTGEPVTARSRGVAVGLEAQADRIPVANEVLAARDYRLPGKDRVVELDAARPESWDEPVAAFLAENMRGHADRVQVERLGGRAGAPAWRVTIGGKDVGVFTILKSMDAAEVEAQVLDLLAGAQLHRISPVAQRGVVGIHADRDRGAVLTERPPGQSVAELIERLPADPGQRAKQIKQLTAAVARTAEGMAELHRTFATGDKMTGEAKWKAIDRVMQHLDEARDALGGEATAKIRVALPRLRDAFLAADLPATAAHGSADAGDFVVDGWQADQGTFARLGVTDVESMRDTLHGGKGAWKVGGDGTAAADLGRFLQSLATTHPGALSASERATLDRAFLDTYAKPSVQGLPTPPEAAGWFRFDTELIAARSGDETAKGRIFALLQIED